MARAILKEFGQLLRERRMEKQLSQEALAAEAQITQTYLSELETGQRNPTILVLLRLCRALEVAPSELLAGFTAQRLRRARLS